MLAPMLALLLGQVEKPPAVEETRDALIKKQTADALALLEKESPADQRRGQYALEDLGRAAEEALVKRLGEEGVKPQVRVLLCDILGEIRASSEAARAALVARLADNDYHGSSVASRAAAALGRIGDPASGEGLLKALAASEEKNDVALRYEAVLALGKLRALEAIGPIQKLLTDKRKTDLGKPVASAAIQALAAMHARGAAEALAGALENDQVDEYAPFADDWTVAQLAVWALEQMVASGDWPQPGKSIVEASRADRATLTSAWKSWKNNRAAVVETRAALEKVAAAIGAYKADTGHLPADLKALTTGEKKYLPDEAALNDGWKRPFEYQTPGWGADFNLFSRGADGSRGGAALDGDLWNHDGWQKAGADKTAEVLRAVGKALEKHAADKGALPADLKKLAESGGPADAVDGWGGPLSYKPDATGLGFSLVSLGYDGKEGGEGPDKDVAYKDLPKQ